MVLPPCLARDIASFSPLMEFNEPSRGTRIFLNLFCNNDESYGLEYFIPLLDYQWWKSKKGNNLARFRS